MNRLVVAAGFAALVSWSGGARADFRLLDVDRINVEVSKFICNREPMTPQYECDDYLGRAAMNIDLRLLEIGYWDNYIHVEGPPSQVRTVGWQWDLGVHLFPALDVYYHHHSRHVMDMEQPVNYTTGSLERFPVEDSYGIRLNFYTNPNRPSTLGLTGGR